MLWQNDGKPNQGLRNLKLAKKWESIVEFFTNLLAELVDKKNKRLNIFRIIKKQKFFK